MVNTRGEKMCKQETVKDTWINRLEKGKHEIGKDRMTKKKGRKKRFQQHSRVKERVTSRVG